MRITYVRKHMSIIHKVTPDAHTAASGMLFTEMSIAVLATQMISHITSEDHPRKWLTEAGKISSMTIAATDAHRMILARRSMLSHHRYIRSSFPGYSVLFNCCLPIGRQLCGCTVIEQFVFSKYLSGCHEYFAEPVLPFPLVAD